MTAVDHFISLDDRLRAAGKRMAIPDEPSRTVAAGLTHIPTRVHIAWGTDEHDKPMLELQFEYQSGMDEKSVEGRIHEKTGKYLVVMDVGKETCRVFRLGLGGFDLSEQGIHAAVEGMVVFFHHYIKKNQIPVRQQVILLSIGELVTNLLPVLVERIHKASAARA